MRIMVSVVRVCCGVCVCGCALIVRVEPCLDARKKTQAGEG